MRHQRTPEWARAAAEAWDLRDDPHHADWGPMSDAEEDALSIVPEPRHDLPSDALSTAVGRLLLASEDLVRAEAGLAAAARRARAAGASWTLIGRSLGMTGEGARRRYGS